VTTDLKFEHLYTGLRLLPDIYCKSFSGRIICIISRKKGRFPRWHLHRAIPVSSFAMQTLATTSHHCCQDLFTHLPVFHHHMFCISSADHRDRVCPHCLDTDTTQRRNLHHTPLPSNNGGIRKNSLPPGFQPVSMPLHGNMSVPLDSRGQQMIRQRILFR